MDIVKRAGNMASASAKKVCSRVLLTTQAPHPSHPCLLLLLLLLVVLLLLLFKLHFLANQLHSSNIRPWLVGR